MNVFIPTYGRANKQVTLAQLPDRWIEKTWLVIRPEEEHLFNYPRIVVVDAKGVPAARQAIVDRTKSQHIWMFDDDLRFAKRVEDWDFESNARLEAMSGEAVGIALDEMEHLLETDYVSVGMDARGMNNGKRQRFGREANRMMRAFGVDVEYLHQYKIKFDKYLYWEDFHVTLSLLKLGFPNWISYQYVNNATTNTAGGCSSYREVQGLQEVREEFLKEHAPWATPNNKIPKSWGGDLTSELGYIPDLKIFWQKAFADGCKQGAERREQYE